MPNTIQTSESAAQQAANEVVSGVQEYTAFNAKSISADIPVSGSSTHDGTIHSTIRAALDAWQSLMDNDKRNIIALNSQLEAADIRAAQYLPPVSYPSPNAYDPGNHFK